MYTKEKEIPKGDYWWSGPKTRHYGPVETQSRTENPKNIIKWNPGLFFYVGTIQKFDTENPVFECVWFRVSNFRMVTVK